MPPYNRYELKLTKYSFKFYDKDIQIDMTLETVINRLNYTERKLNKCKKESINKSKQIIELKKELRK